MKLSEAIEIMKNNTFRVPFAETEAGRVILDYFDDYKWHDLRESTKDLPFTYRPVEIAAERRLIGGKTKVICTHAFCDENATWHELHLYRDDDEEEVNAVDDFVIAWREIERFGEDE